MTTIAVVEDNADNRLLLHAILGADYDVVEYENGADALAGLRARRPDVVLLDISLPGMDGNEILAHIRADGALRALPVIALTAHAMAGDRE
jgi:CheY-like chemotaxis protein